MSDASSRGPEVPAHEDLYRGIIHPDWWDPEDGHLSSGIYGFPKFSAYIASLTSKEACLEPFPDGSGLIKFNSGAARELGFDACHEPEDGEEAHSNVYCDLKSGKRKKQARKLIEATTIVVEPDNETLRASA